MLELPSSAGAESANIALVGFALRPRLTVQPGRGRATPVVRPCHRAETTRRRPAGLPESASVRTSLEGEPKDHKIGASRGPVTSPFVWGSERSSASFLGRARLIGTVGDLAETSRLSDAPRPQRPAVWAGIYRFDSLFTGAGNRGTDAGTSGSHSTSYTTLVTMALDTAIIAPAAVLGGCPHSSAPRVRLPDGCPAGRGNNAGTSYRRPDGQSAVGGSNPVNWRDRRPVGTFRGLGRRSGVESRGHSSVARWPIRAHINRHCARLTAPGACPNPSPPFHNR